MNNAKSSSNCFCWGSLFEQGITIQKKEKIVVGVGVGPFLESCLGSLGPSFSHACHSLHTCQWKVSMCFQSAKIPFVVL
jgi:hypothetical protein